MELGGEEEDDLGQFMEVVTLYKCKFCTFSASTPREMALHVKCTHIKKISYPEVTPSVPSTTQTIVPIVSEVKPSDNLILHGDNTAKLDTTYRRTDTIQSIASDVNYGHTNLSINSLNDMSQNLYSNISSVSLPVPTNNSTSHKNVIITLSNNSDHTMLEQGVSNVVPESSSSGQQIGDYQFICQNADGDYVLQNSDNVQIGNNGTVHVLVQDSGTDPPATADALTENTGESYMVAGSLNERSSIETEADPLNQNTVNVDLEDIQQTDTPEDIVTKELYLCGNCSEGFASIQACKEHMTKVHEVTDFQTSCRVDAGTQVEPKKRPGRKKKCDTVQQVKTDQEEIVMSESDEDWTEQLMSYSTRSRRKRRPPQALKNDYYLGRTKKKEQKKREPKEQNVKCEVHGCGLGFKDIDTMKQHMQCHIEGAGMTGPQFRCTACEGTFDNWRLVRYHMWKDHKIAIDLLSCHLCPIYKTDTPSKLKIHLETHGTERAYACQVCGKTFKQFAQMKNHETCHLPQEVVNSKSMSDKWYTPKTCNICGRRFVNVKCMRKHKEVVHGGRKDFKCTYCSYECSRKAMLILHLRIHTGHKPFKCDLCAYCCGDHNSLRRHKMRHTGQKPYRCPHCPYASIQAISLKVHVKNKHPGMGGIYCCDLCLYKTVNKQQYENHMMDHKRGLLKTEPAVKEIQLDLSKIPQTKRPGTMIFGSNLPTVYTSIAENQNIMQVLQTHGTQNSNIQEVLQPNNSQNSNIQEVIETSVTQPVLHAQPIMIEDGQVGQLQLQMNENDENVITEEYVNEGLAPNDVAAAQLIYSALTAISQNPQNGKEVIDCDGLVAGVENGDIQTSIETNLKEGVTTHTITFHLPEGEQITREVTLQDQNESKDGINVIQLVGSNEWQECDSIAEFQHTN